MALKELIDSTCFWYWIDTVQAGEMMKNVYISAHAGEPLRDYLKSKGKNIIDVSGSAVYDAVAAHPDIYMCRTKDGIIFGDQSKLNRDYPENIIYNAVVLDRYLIHNLKYTADEIIRYADASGLVKIHVNQGYTKCSCVVVDGNTVITADSGIEKALRAYPDIDALVIEPGHVAITGHDEGFLGGASGRVDDEIVFNGDLSRHPDFERICEFIASKGLKVKYFTQYPLTDIGSIIEG